MRTSSFTCPKEEALSGPRRVAGLADCFLPGDYPLARECGHR